VDINGEPTVISTFCGTGGSSLGYKWAGFHELLAVDFDDHAVECFKANFPEVPVWHRSVTEISGKEIMDFCKIKWGELDVFDGSPPCQGFSTAGKRQVSDPRNDLFMHYCRLIHELGPKVFVMENVTGMAKGTFKGKFIEIMQTLKGMNYEVKCKQMNSMYYGVPQSRERLIFIGVRKDLKKIPVYPKASKEIISVRHALKNVQNKDFCETDYKKHKRKQFVLYDLIRKIKPGENASKYIHGGFGIIRLDWNKPSPTITKTFPGCNVNFIHPIEHRNITIQEALVLSSFPNEWVMSGTFRDQWARIGNAVMPKFMQAIAETIKTEILCIEGEIKQ